MTIKRGLILSSIVVAILCVIFLTLHFVDQRHIETTAIMLCESRQRAIYSALVKYKEDNGEAPLELSVLVERGYLKDEATRCPVDLRKSSEEPFNYYADSLGHSESIVISDRVGNHTGKKVFPNVPVVIATFGDGKTRCVLSVTDARSGRYSR